MLSLVALAFMALAFVTLGPAAPRAWANGAFPAPFKVFVPEDRPSDTLVTTNFGLIATTDGGHTWTWACEHGLGDLGYLYQEAPSPVGRILAVATAGVVHSDDGGCSWSVASGLPGGTVVSDFFVPRAAGRIWAIGRVPAGSGQAYALFSSSDAGASFSSTPAYTAPTGDRLDSVEVAAGDPNRIYATASRVMADGTGPWLVRSDDGGKTFAFTDESTAAGPGLLRIAAVDPDDADRVYLRSSGASDRLLLTADAGQTFNVALTAEGTMQLSAFFRRRDGTLLAASMDGVSGQVFRSTNGGLGFELLPDNLHVGSFAERGASLYVLGDGNTDPFLVGVSTDNGGSFQTVMTFADVAGVKACPADLLASCRSSCDNVQNAGLFRPEICTTVVGTAGGDAGAGDAAGPDVGADVGGSPDGASARPPSPSGCGCDVSEARKSRSADGGAGLGVFRLIAVGILGILAFVRRRA